VQIALVAAVVVMAAGLVFALTPHTRYKAETSLIVLPANTLTSLNQASFLEALSSGQVTATMAQVAQSGRFETEAEAAMGLSTAQAAGTTVTVTVAPSTSVLLITAEANSARVAEGLADRTARLAATYLKSIIKAYTATQIRPAAGRAYAAGPSTTIAVAGVLAAALAVAIAAQQASYQLLQARRRTHRLAPGADHQPATTTAAGASTSTSTDGPGPGGAGRAPAPTALTRDSAEQRPSTETEADDGTTAPVQPAATNEPVRSGR
jgi:capsular polysaccharide biosynthesis protein